jgi:hypothetical protein
MQIFPQKHAAAVPTARKMKKAHTGQKSFHQSAERGWVATSQTFVCNLQNTAQGPY